MLQSCGDDLPFDAVSPVNSNSYGAERSLLGCGLVYGASLQCEIAGRALSRESTAELFRGEVCFNFLGLRFNSSLPSL